MPGSIESYDPDTHFANVRPLLKRRFFARRNPVDLPIINRVPVIHPRTASAMIRLPVSVGDIVTLIFADRSLENWLGGNGESKEPLDTRQHHLNDAYAILGGYPEALKQIANNPNALEIVVKSGTKVTLGNGTDELLQLAYNAFTELKSLTDQISQTMVDIKLITHTDPQGGVTGPPINVASFSTIKSTVDGISTNVQTALTSLGKIKV